MADPKFWSGGSLPSEAELRTWLRHQGVSTQGADQIVDEYRSKILNTADSYIWLEEQVNEWATNKVNKAPKTDGTEPLGGDPVSGPSMNDEIIAQRTQEDAELAASNERLADQRSQVIRNQVQSYYDQVPTTVDAGAARGAGLAESIALGFQVDENGEPVLDENGQPLPVNAATLWEQVKGMSFNMGTLSPPRAPVIGKEKRASFFTPTQVLGMLNTMPEDYLTRLQHEMFEAGLYEAANGEGALPSWGKADVATRRAFNELFIQAGVNPNESISDLLNRLEQDRIRRMEAPESGPGAGAQQLPSFTPEVTSEATLNQTIDQIAQHLRGEFASPEEKAALVKTLQDKEIETQRTQYEQSIGDLQAKYAATGATSGSGSAGDAEVDRFMAAIAGQESGGDYGAQNKGSGAYGKFQIMPKNWPAWAERAGLGANAPQTPDNQEIVARRIMLDYYKQFGNWRDVAVAWYSGPGRPDQMAAKRYSDRPQPGGPSINDYANEVMGRFAHTGTTGAGQLVTGTMYPATERFDPAAEAEAILKAQDPAGWQAHEFGNQAIQFYQLLQGVV